MEINFATDLFLGKQELDRFQNAMSTSGYKKALKTIIRRAGVLMDGLSEDAISSKLKVVDGTAGGQITINAGVAVDTNFDLMEIPIVLTDYYTVPSDSTTRNVKIKRAQASVELGSVSIAVDGTITGTDTFFTEVLRGLPDFPIKIQFLNSSLNTQEYEVESVTSDTSAQLNVAGGVLTAESGQEYRIVGTHTPGVSVPAAGKYPFGYDSYTITIDTSGVADENEFLLATVHYTGSVLTIIDKRPQATSNGLVNGPDVNYGGATSPAVYAVTGREGDLFNFVLGNTSGVSFLSTREEGTHMYLHFVEDTFDTVTFWLNSGLTPSQNDVSTFGGDAAESITFAAGDIGHFIMKDGQWHIMNAPTKDRGVATFKKILTITPWDMNTVTHNISHGLTAANIRNVSFMIVDDLGTTWYADSHFDLFATYNATSIILNSVTAGVFATTAFNDTGSNRGYIVVEYVE
jgi:hypothetical protein